MSDFEIITEIKRPVEDVFKFVGDIPNYSNWVPSISPMFLETKVSPGGPIGVGTTFEDKLRFGKTVGKVVEYKPSERIIIEQKWYPESHVSEMRIEYYFEAADSSTKMTNKLDVSPIEIFTPMKAILTEFGGEERQRTCEAIKTTLER